MFQENTMIKYKIKFHINSHIFFFFIKKCFLNCSGHLARHNRIHTGVKPFKCLIPSCNSHFSRQDNMMQHYRSHAKKLAASCLSPESTLHRSYSVLSPRGRPTQMVSPPEYKLDQGAVMNSTRSNLNGTYSIPLSPPRTPTSTHPSAFDRFILPPPVIQGARRTSHQKIQSPNSQPRSVGLPYPSPRRSISYSPKMLASPPTVPVLHEDRFAITTSHKSNGIQLPPLWKQSNQNQVRVAT